MLHFDLQEPTLNYNSQFFGEKYHFSLEHAYFGDMLSFIFYVMRTAIEWMWISDSWNYGIRKFYH